ncbi:calmodulin-binding protein 60 B isoform X2 [Actinidia eriantha]|uniref:calmodulin-binding protein 60 B isoform X2 n=1 Tax=Actinidia eriantha TaxID=165200 RepID=UPI00258BA465|nr:calmodulin-binding protein 60 B isoform X2 [Actinidia eriantha]
MHTRYMERTNSLSRGKRSLEGGDDQPERKRPALASVIVEALKVDSLQKLCSSLEPILRRVVSEEVERALAKLGPARLSGRSSPKRIEGPDGRNLQLQFRSRLSLPLFTGGKVEGEQGAAIHIVLLDANTGHVVTSGPESSAKLDVLVLEGDFSNEDGEDWTQEEFESHVVKEREGKRPLLTGELQVTLKEVYKKHYPPALNDEVWRLEKVGKDGSFHKRLNKEGIFTVEDFLRLVVRDSQKLRHILGSGMSNKMWEALIEHSKTCVLSGKLYVYYPDDTRHVGVVFNNIYALSGLISGEQYFSADSLSDSQKVYVDTLVKKAYDNWNQVVEYDGKSLLSFKQSKRSSASRNELLMGPVDYSNALDNQLPQPRLPGSLPSEQSLMEPSLMIGGSGYNDDLAARYPTQSQFVNSNSRAQFDSNLFPFHDQQISNSHQIQSNRTGLALGPPQSSSFETIGSSVQNANLNPFDDWSNNRDKVTEDFMSEEEIRIRSHEILESEDMQHLLRFWSMGNHAPVNGPEDGFTFPSYIPSPSPSFGFDEDRGRSGKAVVGWLKIKAAMRWGFFIRKKAAERRAQLVELDDE